MFEQLSMNLTVFVGVKKNPCVYHISHFKPELRIEIDWYNCIRMAISIHFILQALDIRNYTTVFWLKNSSPLIFKIFPVTVNTSRTDVSWTWSCSPVQVWLCWAEGPGCPAPSKRAWTAAGRGLFPSPRPPPAARRSRTDSETSRSQTPAAAPPWWSPAVTVLHSADGSHRVFFDRLINKCQLKAVYTIVRQSGEAAQRCYSMFWTCTSGHMASKANWQFKTKGVTWWPGASQQVEKYIFNYL